MSIVGKLGGVEGQQTIVEVLGGTSGQEVISQALDNVEITPVNDSEPVEPDPEEPVSDPL